MQKLNGQLTRPDVKGTVRQPDANGPLTYLRIQLHTEKMVWTPLGAAWRR